MNWNYTTKNTVNHRQCTYFLRWLNQRLMHGKSLITNNYLCDIFIYSPNEVGRGVNCIHLVRPSICRYYGFRSLTQVFLGILFSNFICMLFVAMGRSLLISSYVTSKMTGSHIGFFSFRTLTLVWLWISSPNFTGKSLCARENANWFSAMSLSKWLPGGHIGFFSMWNL